MLLLIDNYDSFVFNLARYFERLGQETLVVRNDAIGVADALAVGASAIVISPGPCTPDQAGCTLELVRQLHAMVPILGICLGHQAIGQALGARVVRAQEPVHGRSSLIRHSGEGIFAGLPNPLRGCRYHSLCLEPESMPECLLPTAWTADGTIMACEHRRLPVAGLQFHPESILTECGYPLLAAFLRRAGIAVHVEPRRASELAEPQPEPFVPPAVPITF